jgi:flavin-dependent dehydrogenase
MRERMKEVGHMIDRDFTYSSGWIHHFKQHHGLSQCVKQGETTEVSAGVVEVGIQRGSKTISEYDH